MSQESLCLAPAFSEASLLAPPSFSCWSWFWAWGSSNPYLFRFRGIFGRRYRLAPFRTGFVERRLRRTLRVFAIKGQNLLLCLFVSVVPSLHRTAEALVLCAHRRSPALFCLAFYHSPGEALHLLHSLGFCIAPPLALFLTLYRRSPAIFYFFFRSKNRTHTHLCCFCNTNTPHFPS